MDQGPAQIMTVQSYEHAVAFVTSLTGSPDTVMDWRALHDDRGDLPGRNRRGTLAQCWIDLCRWNAEGWGVFAVINETDGVGRTTEHIRAVRAHFIDCDNPTTATAIHQQAMAWGVPPHFSVHTSPGKYHIYWLVNPYQPGEAFSYIQRQLMTVFGDVDQTISDPTRVMRVPGFLHQKSQPGGVKPLHVSTIHAGTAWGQTRHSIERVQAALTGVQPVEGSGAGTGGRHDLGKPSMSAPSLDWCRYALDQIDPNQLSRADWIAITAAFKQAAWLHGDESEIRAIWDAWCAQYDANDPGENHKQWNDLRKTSAGWNALRDAAGLFGTSMFGAQPAQMPEGASASPGASSSPAGAGQSPQQPGGGSAPIPEGDPFGTMLDAADQAVYFKGCYFIEKEGKILVPSGRFMGPGQFNGRYGGKQFIIKAEGQGMSTDEAWKAATRGQLYRIPNIDHVRFLPMKPPEYILKDEFGRKGINTYIPANIEMFEGDPTPFVNHIRKILPTERDVLIVLNRWARMVQTPGVKIPWSIVIQSAEGVGKNVIKFCMSHAMGSVYTYYPKAAELAETGGKFNAWMRNKLYILCDEVKTDDKRNLIEALKDMISERIIQIQGKGVDQDIEDNFANWDFFTNWEDAIPIDRKSRRWAIFYSLLQTEHDIINAGMDSKYFNMIYDWIDNRGGKQIVAHYLKHFHIDPEFDPMLHQRAPKTSSYEAAIVASRTAPEHTIITAIEGDVPGFRNGWVSSAAAAMLLKENDIKVAPQTVAKILRGMGYVHLGQASRGYLQEMGKRANLWHKNQFADIINYGIDQGYES